MKIDFVVTWVDGNDPEWCKEKNKYSPKKDEEAVIGIWIFSTFGFVRLRHMHRGSTKFILLLGDICQSG